MQENNFPVEKSNLRYIVIFVIIALIAGAIIYYSWSEFKKEPALEEEESHLVPIIQEEAILSLVSDKNEYSVNEEIVIDIYLDSQENLVDGVDLILSYDPQYLQVKDKKSFFDTADSVFSNFPSPKIDEVNNQIMISAITAPGQSFQGKGKVASLIFMAQKSGQTTISFDFKKGSTIDSNVSSFSQPADILSQVENITLTIY